MFRILLIEDDILVQFTLRKLLECLNYLVVTANDGNEGLEQCHKYNSSINTIICDIDMPFLDGFQFLQQLKQLEKMLPPFAFLSAYVDAEIVEKVSALGADCIIKKPIDQEILKTVLLALEMKHY